MQRMRPRIRSAAAAAALAAFLITSLAACGDSTEEGAVGSAIDAPFELRKTEGGQQVVGHGISLVVPEGWVASGEESLDPQGRTYEWAVEAPEGAQFPPFVNMSMGVPGETSTGFEAAPDALKTLEGVSPDFEVIDEGEVDVPGVDRAYQMRFERSASFQGSEVMVEQVQVFLDMPDGVLSTVRFQAPAGDFDDSGLPEVLDSLAVAVESS